MQMKHFHFLMLITLMATAATTAFAAEPLTPAQVTTWTEELDTRDSLTRLVVGEKFFKEIPPAQQADASAQILKAGLKKKKVGTPETVLGLLAQRGAQMPWSSDLQKQVDVVANNDHKDLRIAALQVYELRPGTDSRKPIEKFLTDEDETVRQRALVAVRRWPDREAVYDAYLKKNRGVSKRAATVKQATTLLDRSKKGQLK